MKFILFLFFVTYNLSLPSNNHPTHSNNIEMLYRITGTEPVYESIQGDNDIANELDVVDVYDYYVHDEPQYKFVN
ncbi:hypothetical protein K502DRAFT_19441 [Neoconidiobolus thromboides FSU 785]|nr:hypothetical protein K502DRAFT_19441 [Neoconidiobolus thromboides FSU 785]